ncbi:hypothetical protein C8R47DRAFT_573969 [Mycena vitilis]|nr:hypothetical protein C8R47DRAFT_573969 [Mycena vitilis]
MRRPSLPWLRIAPSLATLRYQILSSKSSPSIPESATPVGDSDGKITSSGRKFSSPLHRRLRSDSANKHQDGTEEQGQTAVREYAKAAPAAATSANGSSAFDAALRGLWRRVKPLAIGTETPRSISSFFIGRPSESEQDEDEISGSLLNDHGPPLDGPEPELVQVVGTSLPETGQIPELQCAPSHVPPDEDMWLLFECKIGAGNAALLSETLAMTPPDDLANNDIKELQKLCLESQDIIFAQIPWASISADRSRLAKDQAQHDGDKSQLLTWEEELVSEMLSANERLFAALKLYDDLTQIAVDRKVKRPNSEEASSSVDLDDLPSGSSPRRQPVVPVDLVAGPQTHQIPSPRPATPRPLPIPEITPPFGESSQSCCPPKVMALKAFTADPNDPDEISFGKGDIFDMLDSQGTWWLVQNVNGLTGIAPSDYFRMMYPENLPSSAGAPVHPYSTTENGRSFSEEEIFDVVQKQLRWWKARNPNESSCALSSEYSSVSGLVSAIFQNKAQALYGYNADTEDPRELSFKPGEILAIGDKRADWWQARNATGSIGLVPSNYLRLVS